jgi:ribose/xylose/arabinose/galactoside ABC-type transport system permease subunit
MTVTTDVSPSPAKGARKAGGSDLLSVASRFGALIFLIVVCAIVAILQPAFLTPLNLFNVLRQVSIYGLLAIGMTCVILTGGIDLSIGSLLALAGLVGAALEKGGAGLLVGAGAGQAGRYGIPLVVLTAVAVGMGGGLLQGLAIAKLKVPVFIVTLGGLSVFRGAALVFSHGQPISAFRPEYGFWGKGMVGPVPVPVIIFLAFAVVGYFVLTYTKFGRHIYAVGGNREAARLSGLNVDAVLIRVYVIMGFFAGLSGFLLSSRLNSAEQVAGVGYELIVIAGVAIGGTSMTMGGTGSILGSVVGIVLMGVLANGLTLLNVSAYYQQMVTGLLIVFAVWFDQVVRTRRR